MNGYTINDKVTYLGMLIGRVVSVADGWAVVVDVNGRRDEYRADLLKRAR
jgi:hypothetical protein